MAEPGQYQILRIETYKRLDERLVSHVKGVTRPPTARPVDPDIALVHPEQPPLGAIVELGGEGAGAARELIERTRPTGRGRKPGEAIEILMAGPPSYGSADQWSDVRELEWARESVAWAQRIIGPDSLIVTAALHRDEKSPHVQMLVVPVHEGRLGWTAVKNVAAARIAPGLPHPPRTKYAGFQDDYQAHVGRRFGLARGEVGSQATHAQIHRAEAARAELAKARKTWQRELEEAGRRVEQAAKRERKAIEAADAAGARRLADAEHDARVNALLDEEAAEQLEKARKEATVEEKWALRANRALTRDIHRHRTLARELEAAAREREELSLARAALDAELAVKREEAAVLERSVATRRAELGDLDARAAKLDERDRGLLNRTREVWRREDAVRASELASNRREFDLATAERRHSATVEAWAHGQGEREAATAEAERIALGKRWEHDAEATAAAADRDQAVRDRDAALKARDEARARCRRCARLRSRPRSRAWF